MIFKMVTANPAVKSCQRILDTYFALQFSEVLLYNFTTFIHNEEKRKKKPHIDRGICIHCFCCQEFCPKGAMRQGRHAIMKIFGGERK